MINLYNKTGTVLLEEDGTVRCPNTLELLGRYFYVDAVLYWIPLTPQL